MDVRELTLAIRAVDRCLAQHCKDPRDKARVMGIVTQQYMEEIRKETSAEVLKAEAGADLPPHDQERESWTDPQTGEEAPV